MSDYNLSDPIESELVSYGMQDCTCDTANWMREEYPPCVVCGDNVRALDFHVHYKGETFHDGCLILALLRELNQRSAVGSLESD